MVGARSMSGNSYDGQTLHEALEQAEILSEVKPLMAFIDRGYGSVKVAGVQIWKSGQRRSVTRGLKAMTRRRSAIEPTIGHMKNDGKLGRNWLKGTLGDAMHAVLCCEVVKVSCLQPHNLTQPLKCLPVQWKRNRGPHESTL